MIYTRSQGKGINILKHTLRHSFKIVFNLKTLCGPPFLKNQLIIPYRVLDAQLNGAHDLRRLNLLVRNLAALADSSVANLPLLVRLVVART